MKEFKYSPKGRVQCVFWHIDGYSTYTLFCSVHEKGQWKEKEPAPKYMKQGKLLEQNQETWLG